MQSLVYKVVFDVAEEPAPWAVVVLVLVIFGVAARLAYRHVHRPAGWAVLGVGVLVTTFTAVHLVGADWRDKRVLADGHALVVEGTVEHHHPAPPGGHGAEWYDVNGVRLYGVGSAVAPVPPIHDGLHVRVHYMQVGRATKILRLELADDVTRPAAS